MTRRYRICHETRYRYAEDVVHAHHLLHLVPRPANYQECLEHEIDIVPAPRRRVAEVDAFGNPLLRIELAAPHRELSVVSKMQPTPFACSAAVTSSPAAHPAAQVPNPIRLPSRRC